VIEGESALQRQPVASARHQPCASFGRAPAMEEYDIVPTVEANGNKPISPLSAPLNHVVLINELQLGRRSSHSHRPKISTDSAQGAPGLSRNSPPRC
jgi:hypothetical protein